MSTFTLSQEDYEALISYARAGTKTPDESRVLDAFLKTIEAASGITRSFVWIQWQEQDQPLPPTTAFPEVWPPEMRYYFELLSRPVAKSDVVAILKLRARKPQNVLVTKDPGAVLGWTSIDAFFTQ